MRARPKVSSTLAPGNKPVVLPAGIAAVVTRDPNRRTACYKILHTLTRRDGLGMTWGQRGCIPEAQASHRQQDDRGRPESPGWPGGSGEVPVAPGYPRVLACFPSEMGAALPGPGSLLPRTAAFTVRL